MLSTAADQPPKECDIAVVGGGIVGLATARELMRRQPDARLCVLEAEAELSRHQTSHSSGVIHAGIYYRPDSLKARLCVEGARELYAYCDERQIRYRQAGKLIVAVEQNELKWLDELERRGVANRVPGLRRLDAGEIASVESNARGAAALHSPHTGIVDFGAVSTEYAADVTRAGGSIHLAAAVIGAKPTARGLALHHARGTTEASAAVFCAGLWSDRIAVACGAPKSPRIVPFRGGYLELPREAAELVRGNVYPIPDPDLPFLGAHVTPTIDGRVLIGPSALLAPARDAYRLSTVRVRDIGESVCWPGTWRMAARNWRAGLLELRHATSRRAFAAQAVRMLPGLSGLELRPGPAGIRAQAIDRDGALVDDFVVHRTERAIHVRNAPSPAATSSLALARLIADELAATVSA